METTTKKTYNGYTNYETWNVKLWIDNDQESQEYWLASARTALKDAEADNLFTKEENATNYLREELKEEFHQGMPDLGASTYADLLNSAMSEVNWHEIAQDLINDCKEIDRLTHQ
jgi:hypothetical protein